MKGLIVVAGALAQRPGRGGHTWVFLQYLRGFLRLDWDVHLVDYLDEAMATNRQGERCPISASWNLAYFVEAMAGAGLAGKFSLTGSDHVTIAGVPRHELRDRIAASDLLLNVMGYLTDEELLTAAKRKVFLDIDPGFPQFWHDQGLADVFRGHDAFVTIGENIGQPACTIPTCGRNWITTPQPVVLDDWPVVPGGDSYTTVASWRGLFGPIINRGQQHGLRVHEFRRFVELPAATSAKFEIALDIDSADASDTQALWRSGWQLRDPLEVAGDAAAYRRFIQSSRGEFMVAKNLYVETNSGWISDRSLCYLASGKPVVMQDTGIRNRYPSDAGILAFSEPGEAADRICQVEADYDLHSRRAREIAHEHFDSDKVLRRLLEQLGVS